MSRREQYPAAPAVEKATRNLEPTGEGKARRQWFNRRNAAIQAALQKPKDGVTFGRKGKS